MRPSVGAAEARESSKIPFKAEQSSGVAALDWGGQGRQEDFLDRSSQSVMGTFAP